MLTELQETKSVQCLVSSGKSDVALIALYAFVSVSVFNIKIVHF